MEINDPLHFSCLSSTPAVASLKSSPSLEDSLHTNGTRMSSTQLGRVINGELNMNGITLDQGASTSEAFAPTAPSPEPRDSNPNSMSGYDFFWDCGQYQPTDLEKLKEKLMLSQLASQGQGQGQHQSNGVFEAGIKDISIDHSAMSKSPKLCDERTQGSTSLEFDPYGLCSQKTHFDMVHETSSFSPNQEFSRTISEEVQAFTYPYEHCVSQPDMVDLEDADLQLFCGKDYDDVVDVGDKETTHALDGEINGCVESKMEELKMASNPDLSSHPLFTYDTVQCLENSVTFNIPDKESPRDSASVLMMPFSSASVIESGSECESESTDCDERELEACGEQGTAVPGNQGNADHSPGNTDHSHGNTDHSHGNTDQSPGNTDHSPGNTNYSPENTSPFKIPDPTESTDELESETGNCPEGEEMRMSQRQPVSALTPPRQSSALCKSSRAEPQTPASPLITPNTTPSPRAESCSSGPDTAEGDETDVKSLSNLVMSSLSLSDGDIGGCEGGEVPIPSSNPLKTSVKSQKKAKKCDLIPDTTPTPSFSTPGDYTRRRVTDERELRIPLEYGWRREIRIRRVGSHLQGETIYYAPCGKRLRQFPEVIKYLTRNAVTEVGREHFSFSPRMNVGDFFEEQESAEEEQWQKVSPDDVPLRIKAMMRRRGRPPNPDKLKACEQPRVSRGKGRPPKATRVTLLSKADAKLMKTIELQAEPQETNPQKKPPKEQRVKSKRKEKQVSWRGQRVRQKQQAAQLAEHIKKPTEDMYLSNQKPLPEFGPIPGLVLSGPAFADCLIVTEFLHNYGKVLGFDSSREVPTLNRLQEGLLNVGDSLGLVQDLLVRLLQIAVADPGLSLEGQSVTILGKPLCDIGINRDNVSEVLRVFLEASDMDREFCQSLKVKSFHAHPAGKKASVLAFLVNELLGSNTVIREIDKNIDHRVNIRKNKWIVEGKLRRLKRALLKKQGIREPPESTVEDGRRKRTLDPEEDSRGAAGNAGEERVKEEMERTTSEEKAGNLSRTEDHHSASVAELERQIEKLSKRQNFFARKLLQASQSLRALLLGQDRFRRRYWVFPHLGGLFVEGSEAAAGPEELSTDKLPVDTHVKVELRDAPTENVNAPGRPKSGRCRKRKTEQLTAEPPKRSRAASNSRKSSRDPAAQAQVPAQHSAEHSAAWFAWLSLLQNSMTMPLPAPHCSTSKPGPYPHPHPVSPELLLASNRRLFDLSVPSSEKKVKDCAERHGQWFSLLPRKPCSSSAITQLPLASQQAALHPAPQLHHTALQLPASAVFAALQFMPYMGIPLDGRSMALLNPAAANGTAVAPGALSGSTLAKGRARTALCPPTPHSDHLLPQKPRPRGRPPTKSLKKISEPQLSPIPKEMQSGWWCVTSPEELILLLKALHPWGIREKALHKQLNKHMEYISQSCTKERTDPIFHPVGDETERTVSKEMLETWKEEKWVFETDLNALQQVEALEQRVVSASLQVKDWSCPDTDSTRDDLVYLEPRQAGVECREGKDEGELELMRRNNNPLVLGVTRLLGLEPNIERRYLRQPLWNPFPARVDTGTAPQRDGEARADQQKDSEEGEISPGLSVWRETLLRTTSAAQLCNCIQQLERALSWEKSIMRVSCQICRKGDNDEFLLLCDNCDQGCHTYCLRPQIADIPDGDWFCPICVSRANNRSGMSRRSQNPRRRQKRERFPGNGMLSGSGARKYMKRRRKRMTQDGPLLAKRRRTSKRNHSSDLTLCEIILMEMESHDDAWPFLQPVNPRLVPGYRRIIKNPMDFTTIRDKLISGKYSSCEEFATDATLVFNNCVTFNEDDSEVGQAGYIMRKFFESRWAEFYHSS
ncbi:bromodomain adjacent to zinc finger domain protein 2A isoform X2 [Callorhinchus milii]|nr:bromodomain adjacent to zinc finger domain protein 2A isoform X2 [Callorhinchus milii]